MKTTRETSISDGICTPPWYEGIDHTTGISWIDLPSRLLTLILTRFQLVSDVLSGIVVLEMAASPCVMPGASVLHFGFHPSIFWRSRTVIRPTSILGRALHNILVWDATRGPG